MITVQGFKGETVAVMGLARSGLAAAEALMAGGARVLAWDDAPGRRDTAQRRGVPLADLAATRFGAITALVLSPGIPHSYPKPNPIAAAARAAGTPIIGDIELLARSVPEARYVGVTGTNGKSTTTALIAHILSAAGRRVDVGGNLGTPALSLARLGADGCYVLELSSYQLELIDRASFDVAVWLNLTPDHLDRHGGLTGYIAAKRRIFQKARGNPTAVIGVDDAPSRAMADALSRENAWRVTRISVISRVTGGVFVADGWLIDETGRSAEKVMDLREVPLLPGRHNWQNAAAAYAAARALGLARADIVAGIASFPGLAHRQETVATVAGVRFVNDSKATNADAAATALACYDRVYWIAGGVPKTGGITSLTPYFPRIRRAFLIGDAAEDFAATLGDRVPHQIDGTLDNAVAAAFRVATADSDKPVVLLSPACASFDQFSDFEARGEAFRALVKALPGAAP
ncbi:MAG TPA: UDP-N-acetylmuramoyl-L-alanine--D-glutamate ligase [Stellaceae bacterium]|nr:UDP-N-acetylmuramoyl-L-alanine--D-glutamate ligase [Stellaceae bacterium]